ncbi:MAG: ribosome recycling factor [Candidatus Brocadiia bacterium]
MSESQNVLKDAETKMGKAVEALEHEYNLIRTGRANVSILSGIKVNYYGNPTPLNQMANVAAQDARTLAIRPFDASVVKDIEKAILASDLGLTPSNDGKVVRLSVPPLTGERRKALSKQVGELAEKAKVSIRTIRRDTLKTGEDLKKSSVITEDELERFKKSLQDAVTKYEKKAGEVADKKNKEIMEV